MNVRMKIGISGFRNSEPWPPIGGIIDVPDTEAQDLIRNGYAEPVDEHDVAAEASAVEEPAAGDDDGTGTNPEPGTDADADGAGVEPDPVPVTEASAVEEPATAPSKPGRRR